MMMCTDNRFEIIEKAKKDILEATNINTSPDEMKVLDNFLMRCWQMDWLKKYEQPKVGEWIPCSERLPQEDGEYLVWYDCGDGEDEEAEKGFMLVPFWTDVEKFGVYQDIFDSHTMGFVDSEFYECETAIAWMPLPNAYKGE